MSFSWTQQAVVVGLMLAMPLSVLAHGKDKELEDRVARLERMADNPVLVKLSRRLGEQQREIQDLQDQIDRLQYQMKKLSKQLDQRYKETDDRLSKLEKQGVNAVSQPVQEKKTAVNLAAPNSSASANKVMPVPEPTGNRQKSSDEPLLKSPEVIQTRPATAAEKKAYQDAFALMKSSKYKEAAAAFTEFRQKHSQSDLASNASYWAGEAHMVLDDKSSGLASFKDVVDVYPKSSKAPAAMLRMADTEADLGNTAEAKKNYQALIDQHPKTKVAEKAKKRLKALK